MSDSETNDPLERTELMESSSDDPKRSLDGRHQLADLIAWLDQQIQGEKESRNFCQSIDAQHAISFHSGALASILKVKQKAKQLEKSNAASTGKARKPHA